MPRPERRLETLNSIHEVKFVVPIWAECAIQFVKNLRRWCIPSPDKMTAIIAGGRARLDPRLPNALSFSRTRRAHSALAGEPLPTLRVGNDR